MPVFSENKYLQSLLENLIASHETEINYLPIEIELDPDQITERDIPTLLTFVKEARKRFFIFKLPNNELITNRLALTARRAILNQTAEIILQSTSSDPKINPLKEALNNPPPTVRAAIQIQKSFTLPKQSRTSNRAQSEYIEQIPVPDLVLLPLDLPEFPTLAKQLEILGIQTLQDIALQKIKEHPYVFTDGIIPSNLPKGFYIDKEKHALCYTATPHRFPSALAPVLEKPTQLVMPTLEQAQALLPATITEITIAQLLDAQDKTAQKNALISVLPAATKEILGFLNLLNPAELDFIVPALSKQFILGGEAHTLLLMRLIKNCLNKKLSLEFIKDPAAQNAFLSPRGIKNLQKLLQLPAEQKEWWNTLTIAHLKNERHHFDFNTFFEAYTQIFLPRIAEKNLTLPHPCPIHHSGHILITLNRILDVLEHAQNPQEQCLTLVALNWGPTGVHYAMTQAPERFKHVAACMKLENPEDTKCDPESVYEQIETEILDLKPWVFRYMGQYWKKEIRLVDIQAQLEEIQNLATWTTVQKNQLLFILTCTFSEKSTLTAENWKKSLKGCISLLQPLEATERTNLLQTLSRCFQFKPSPSLVQIQTLIEQCRELKTAFPNKDFKNELITPLISCLENEGFELINTLQERVQKTDPTPTVNQSFLIALDSFIIMLQSNRQNLPPDVIKLLVALNEPKLTQTNIDDLILAIRTLQTKKNEAFCNALFSLLGKINISKSQLLPNIQQILDLIPTLSASDATLPEECNTLEKQESWLKDLIIEKNLLPGCVIGNGDISKLDDLIVDALVDAVKKRSTVLKIDKLKASLEKNLQSKLVPEQLRAQLNQELWPLFDALNDLVTLLQTPNPQFEELLEKLRFFEEKKPNLLEATYSVGLLGQSKGEYLLSYILAGKRKETDNTTGIPFAALLTKLHGLITNEINSFFDDEQNKNAVKDLDAKTTLDWLATFNDTHTLTFLFKEELVQKKVLPALKKTLLQLNTQDPIFENSILEAAADLAEDQPADQSLQNYKTKIEAIASYLNLLIDLKDRAANQFHAIYKQLNTGALARLNYTQKQILISNLLRAKPESLELYLKLTTNTLEETPDADAIAIDRAINGLVTLFELSDLEPETQIMFFKMSMTHNLKNPSPFPLATLNRLKKSNLGEQTKSLIIKQIIQILSRMTNADSPDLIQGLVQQTESFLTQNPEQAPLCIALLKRVSLGNLSRDLNAYPNILSQLSVLNAENRGKLFGILTDLANSKKDDSVNLPTLLDITKGLARRSSDIGQVLKLFATPPYPIAQTLNTALIAHDSEKLHAYCLNFDTNPFAKTGETRAITQQFATDRIQDALLSLKDLMHGFALPHSLQLQLARQLTYIETLGYTDPLNPNDYKELKKLTACSRHDLKERASTLLNQLRSKTLSPEQTELTQIELLAYLREIYFRTTGLFPNSTQMLMLLLSLNSPSTNLLMRIKTGEGKSLITPMLAVLQWAQGGTVDVCTANRTLSHRDYENSCEPFFKFLGIKSALIQGDSQPKDYQLGGINCSTLEDMSLFRLATKEAKQEALIQNGDAIHLVLDECDDALLDQNTLYKLVAENAEPESKEDNNAQWIYPLAYQFINLPLFRNTDPAKGKVWDEDEDLEQFRLYINKEINEKFNGDAKKQNFMMAASNTQLRQWIHASCKAATLIENKHFIVQPVKEKDETGSETIKKIVCVPLVRSAPKTGCIFTDGVQQALQARLIAERKEQARYFVIDADPPVLASQSARGLIQFYQNTKGRLLGISGTPGDPIELQYLSTLLGTQAIGVAPYAGDKRKKHPPTFTFSREETIHAIHKAIDKIKLPITKPKMEFEADIPIQTLEEREAFILRTKEALQKWNQTQTQPILIVSEDFEDAQTIGRSFEAYKNAGFKIQIVTGKESPEELEHIIKQAGRANTITIGTAMLARGIDINPGDHPEGLFVIQTYTDSKRMTTQIAGRAARNGKPGQWLPIYQIQPPQDWLNKIMYFILPWFRQRMSQNAVEKLQTEIKLQASIDRLYTQAIDKAQQTLMQQVHAWENLLLELHPTDNKLQHELYQWREALLSELTHFQKTSVSQDTLESSITQFQNSLCKLWETVREEKWAAKAQKTTVISPEQSLRLNYLKNLDLTQELNIQAALQQKSLPFKAGTKALMQQNIETILLDKAGAVLEFTTPTEAEKKNLELAQSRQLLPQLIGELCAVYPQAIKKENHQTSFFLPEILNSLVEKFIEQKNKALGTEDTQPITQAIIRYYQKELKQADTATIQTRLEQVKSLLLAHNQTLAKAPLIEKFKVQGLILTFSKLYQQSGLPDDEQLNKLKTRYDDEIMKMLAEHLLNELAWVNEVPQPIHAYLERPVAKEAANIIYLLAEDVRQSPKNKKKIQALYTGLQEQRVNLQDKHLFSISHTNPLDVINMALAAIESLDVAPHCDHSFQETCHDKVLSAYHLAQFHACLEKTSLYFRDKNDPTWEHLKNTLIKISTSTENQNHLIAELYEAIERFSTYAAYLPYKNQLKVIKAQLTQSMEALKKSNGLKQDIQESLLAEKASQFAALFNVGAEQVRIQSGCDGIQSYIEVQIENTELKEGFTGYQSSSLKNLENEKARIALQKRTLESNQEALINLSDIRASESLPPTKQAEFEKLFRLKTLLMQDWRRGIDNSIISELPEPIKSLYNHIQQLKQWDWTPPLDPEQFNKIFGSHPIQFPGDLVEKLTKLNKELQEIQARKSVAKQKIHEQNNKISNEESKVISFNARLKEPDCGLSERISLNSQMIAIKAGIAYFQATLAEPMKILARITEEETTCQDNLNHIIQSLDIKRGELASNLEAQAKRTLDIHLHETSKQLVDSLQQELNTIDTTVEQLNQLESKKSRYQTHRFFNSSELLRFEASLVQEETLIPMPVKENVRPYGLMSFLHKPVKKTTVESQSEETRPLLA